MTTRKHTIKVGKAEIVHSTWSKQITFVDIEGNERQIDDEVGHVMRLVEVIQKGSGKKIQPNVTHDHTHDGLPPDNLVVRGGGMGQPQRPQ